METIFVIFVAEMSHPNLKNQSNITFFSLRTVVDFDPIRNETTVHRFLENLGRIYCG